MAEHIDIRPAVAGDEGSLAALSATVQALHVRERPDLFKPVDLDSLGQWFRETLAAGPAKVWIAEVGGASAGYVLASEQRRPENVFGYERRCYEVEQIGVHPDYRLRGVARALLRRVADVAEAQGITEIELTTWGFNTPARDAFQKLGLVVKTVRFARGPQ